MAANSRLGKQIAELTTMLTGIAVPHALIGGLALASHNVIRATQDVDLLVPLEKADEIDAQLRQIGYQCVHRSSNAGNYVRGTERVDFLYASPRTWRTSAPCCEPIAASLILPKCASTFSSSVVSRYSMTCSNNSTDQPFVNDAGITPAVVSDEDPYRMLDDLMVVVEALCPIWPERGAFVESDKMLL